MDLEDFSIAGSKIHQGLSLKPTRIKSQAKSTKVPMKDHGQQFNEDAERIYQREVQR